MIIGAALLGTAYVFQAELSFLWRFFSGLPMLLSGITPGNFPPPPEVTRFFIYIGLNIVGWMIILVAALFFISEGIYPIRSNFEHREALNRFIQYLTLKKHPLIFIKEGRIIGDHTPRQSISGGVALLDQSSAIVIEKKWSTRNPVSSYSNPESLYETADIAKQSRVAGPGLVFIKNNERLKGIVNLRRQFRTARSVMGHTSEGIEVKTNVSTTFTVGEPATIIKVTYIGISTPENLRVIKLDPYSRRIIGILDELDTPDKLEIDKFVHSSHYFSGELALLEFDDNKKNKKPFQVDENRIRAAFYSQAYDVDESQLDNWTVVPALVATELFRNMISQMRYDMLYMPEDPTRFPLQSEFKPHFSQRMRHSGVLGYQYIQRHDGLSAEIGQRVESRLFRISKAQELCSPKLLRERGIKILWAGFSELIPTDPAVKQQRLDLWRRRWQQEADKFHTDLDLEVTRIRNHARVEKKSELIGTLSKLLKNNTLSGEAITLSVFHALEEYATDPRTRELLHSDTINTLNNLVAGLQNKETLPDQQNDKKVDKNNREGHMNDKEEKTAE